MGLAELFQGKPTKQRLFLPTPEQYGLYTSDDPSFPSWIKSSIDRENTRDFIYQMVSYVGGFLFGISLVGTSTFLVYTNHPKMATVLLGANMISLAGKLLSNRRE